MVTRIDCTVNMHNGLSLNRLRSKNEIRTLFFMIEFLPRRQVDEVRESIICS